MPSTARNLGVDPWNPQQNLEGGARYLFYLLKQYGGDMRKALAAYNMGPGYVASHGVGAGAHYADSIIHDSHYDNAQMQTMAVPSGGGSPSQALPFDPLAGFKYKVLGGPGQGTHTVGNWQSDNAWDYGAPAGTPVYAVSSGTIDPNHYGPLASSGRFGGNRVTLLGQGNEFFYQHLADNLAVKPGQHVNAGDLLGYIGNIPGLGNHLHFGVMNLPQPGKQFSLPSPSTPSVAPAAPAALPLMPPAPTPTTYQISPPAPLDFSVPKVPTFASPAPPPGFLDQLSSGGAQQFNQILNSLIK
jgi:hypothetical protein